MIIKYYIVIYSDIIIDQHRRREVYIKIYLNYNIMLPLNNPDTMTVNTVNKLTIVNTLLIIVDSRTPQASITAKVITIK